jgi:hypothetical protein
VHLVQVTPALTCNSAATEKGVLFLQVQAGKEALSSIIEERPEKSLFQRKRILLKIRFFQEKSM